MKKMQTLTVNGNAYQVSDPGAVSFAEAQTLTEEQKTQAKKNLGIAGQYELIEDITLSADTASFYRAQEPNGRLYAFEKIKLFVTFAAAKSNCKAIFYTKDANNEMIFYHAAASGSIGTEARSSVITAYNEGGFVNYSAICGVGSNDVNQQSNPEYSMGIWRNVVRLYINPYPSGNVIPAGTRIQIYAIRG